MGPSFDSRDAWTRESRPGRTAPYVTEGRARRSEAPETARRAPPRPRPGGGRR